MDAVHESPTPPPVETSPEARALPGRTLPESCVARVGQTVPPAEGVSTTPHYSQARQSARADGLHVVEVPYTAVTPSGTLQGSYVCGATTANDDADFLFFSDHERLTATQWNEYVTGLRPGNLETLL